MAARIIHFGIDACNRSRVLRSAGYDVEDCISLPILDFALHSDGEPAAIVVSEIHEVERHEAITLAHSNCGAPVILFEHHTGSLDESAFDLVIPVLTPTKEWLAKIASTIERARVLHTESKTIHEQAALLRQESKTSREKSIQERQRSGHVRSRSKVLPDFVSKNDKKNNTPEDSN